MREPAWVTHVKTNGCGALPRAAELELMAASQVEPSRRMRAIDRAYERTTTMFPDLFKE